MGRRCSAEDCVDKLSWGGITVAGDNETCWGLNFHFVKRKNSAGDDFPVATLLGISLLDLLGMIFRSLLGMIFQTPLGIFLYSAGDDKTFQC